ncbi:MAG: multicopper oxidase domain-containing protein, partial [Geodermatophilaceae bacterium]
DGVPVRHDTVQIMPQVRGTQAFQRVFTKKASQGKDYELGTNVLKGPWCGGFRRDVALLGPRTEIKLYSRWPDFLGRYILHCHNVVHEDHSMMARWEILPPGQGFDGPKMDSEVYGRDMPPQHLELRPARCSSEHGERLPHGGAHGHPGGAPHGEMERDGPNHDPTDGSMTMPGS